jgi:hypothetical protein
VINGIIQRGIMKLTLDGEALLSMSPTSSASLSTSMEHSGYVSIVSFNGNVSPVFVGSLQCGCDAFDNVPCFSSCCRGIFSDVWVAQDLRGVGAAVSDALFNETLKWVFGAIVTCK